MAWGYHKHWWRKHSTTWSTEMWSLTSRMKRARKGQVADGCSLRWWCLIAPTKSLINLILLQAWQQASPAQTTSGVHKCVMAPWYFFWPRWCGLLEIWTQQPPAWILKDLLHRFQGVLEQVSVQLLWEHIAALSVGWQLNDRTWSDCLTKRTRSNPKLPSHFVKITKPRHFNLFIPNPKTGFMYNLSYIITYHNNIHFRTFSNMIWSSNQPTSTPYGSPRSAPGLRSPRSPRRRIRPRCPRAPGGWNSTRAWPSPPAGQRLGMEKHLDEHYIILYIIYIIYIVIKYNISINYDWKWFGGFVGKRTFRKSNSGVTKVYRTNH